MNAKFIAGLLGEKTNLFNKSTKEDMWLKIV